MKTGMFKKQPLVVRHSFNEYEQNKRKHKWLNDQIGQTSLGTGIMFR